MDYEARSDHNVHFMRKIIRGKVNKGRKMINEQYLHSELTGKIIGCAMEVHKTLGNGFQEVIYQRALDIEMAQQGLTASREHEMDIYYKGIKIGNRRADFFVEGKVKEIIVITSQSIITSQKS